MTLRITWRRALLGLGGLALAGLLFAWSGVLYIGATGGHSAPVGWFLHWVMQNSIRTHALPHQAPDLSDPALLPRGAGHYATSCAPCHGAPGQPQSPVLAQSTPPPPALAQGLADWSAEELFVIIRHGVRYSGMPGWVAPARQDEVWAMVAFLRQMPGLDAARYLALAEAGLRRDPATPPATPPGLEGLATRPGGGALAASLRDCARCHGLDGLGAGTAFPILAGQSAAYLEATLRDYAEARRQSGIMQPAAARPDPAQLRALAEHYAAQPHPGPAGPAADPAMLEEGGRLAREGFSPRGVPACLSCHGGAALARNPALPRLHGQHAGYLENQLALWREGARGGGESPQVMAAIAGRLSPGQARAVAAWFAAAGPVD